LENILSKTQSLKNLQEDPNYIILKRYNFSIERLLERYPDGVPDHIIAEALDLTADELNQQYAEIISCLRDKMRV
jgi:hypothetical protein